MATRDFVISQDGEAVYRISTAGSLGQGKGDHLTVGALGDYRIRSYLQFVHDWSSMTSVSQVILRMKKSTAHGSWGGSPRAYVKQVMASWDEGTKGADGLWYGTNALEWDSKPSVAGGVSVDSGAISVAGDGWFEIDITTLAREWAPTTVTVAGSAGQNESNYGIELSAYSGDSSTSNQFEAYSSDYGSYDAILRVTYESYYQPNAPTYTNPTAYEYVEDASPVYATIPTVTFQFTHNPGSAGALVGYDFYLLYWQVGVGWTTFQTSLSQTTGVSGNNVSRNWWGTALSRGTLYAWRADTYDAGGIRSVWTMWEYFYVNDAADVTQVLPGSAQLAKLSYAAGQNTPRIMAQWTYSDPNSHPQGWYQVWLYADSGGSVGAELYTSGKTAGTASTLTIPWDLTEGNYYHVRVQVWDSLNLSKGAQTRRCRARWGTGHYRSASLGGAPSVWSVVANSSFGSESSVYVEYNSSTDGSTLADAWKANLADVTLRTYFHYRVWLMAWGASPATPSLNSLVLTYTTAARSPDGWSGSDGAIDVAAYYYGTQSLKIAGDGTSNNRYQTVTLKANEPYTLSARIKSQGNSGACVRLTDLSGNVLVEDGVNVSTVPLTASQEFTTDLEVYQFYTPTSDTTCRVECLVTGASGTTGWFDALMLENSRVVSPWNPAQIGVATVVDAAGVQVDAQGGGVARFRGSLTDSADNLVQLGQVGWKNERGQDFKEQGATPATPPSGYGRLYVRSSDKAFCWVDSTGAVTVIGAGGGAPTTADYLVGTANGSLSAEIVVGTTPGGELGGSWASPTVDATHSGSAHHTQSHGIISASDHPTSSIQRGSVSSGAISAGSSADVTVTFGANFADTNYTVLVCLEQSDATGREPGYWHLRTNSTNKAVGSCVARVFNPTAVSQTYTVRWVAVHD